ncbi:MAG: S1 RNA-binding domain-containing protein [Candidatus Anstonellales archaeon]
MSLPEKDEIVIAKVKKILPYGAFCVLPEYSNIEGFMHISEVSSGWVKNIHEFISEGDQLVVKVIGVNPDKKQIDLSLKNVTEDEKRKKKESLKKEKRCLGIIKAAFEAANEKGSPEELYRQIEQKHGNPAEFLEKALSNQKLLDTLKISKKAKAVLFDYMQRKLKKPEVEVRRVFELTSQESDGMVRIVKALLEAQGSLGIQVHYMGAPKYMFIAKSANYKDAEDKLKKAGELMKKHGLLQS